MLLISEIYKQNTCQGEKYIHLVEKVLNNKYPVSSYLANHFLMFLWVFVPFWIFWSRGFRSENSFSRESKVAMTTAWNESPVLYLFIWGWCAAERGKCNCHKCCLTTFGKGTWKNCVLAHIVSILIIYIKFTFFFFFHKVFEVIDNIKTHKLRQFRKTNHDEILFGEVTCNEPTIELLTLLNKFSPKYFGSQKKLENMMV